MFKKDDYIVITWKNEHDQFPPNFIYKQRENLKILAPYRDGRGSVTNSWGAIDPNNNKNWRYATPQEIEEYNRIGKPFDVNNMVEREPKYEIY